MEYRDCTIEIDDEEVRAILHPKSTGVGISPPERVPLTVIPLGENSEQEAIEQAKQVIDDRKD
ncbi:hypothetical protein SAMN05421858_5061 [Haladaptatus litoreus]|uniref:Uncharacterized protein n=1 Tax=Haladaptatus litoreus TaxID=553468 RepID=A0A1N7FHG9_9EURY|nr:hypothetical protein [Haladaptatus litoreus]SIR99771.1 hypothetical protein SAMN05421858_5061 [Haladaptatus litoreus]